MAAGLFYSYSHRDEDLRAELEKHLSLLRRSGHISEWHDRRLEPGTEWKGEIDEHLRSAQIILLLISADFLASDYCYDIEMKVALERHDRGEAVVIPVILRPVDWMSAPFARIQGLPKDARPITTWANRDEAFADVARGIREVVTRKFSGAPAPVPVVPHPPVDREQERVLDAALPKQVTVGEPAELLAMIRRSASGGLRAILNIEEEPGVAPEDVRSRPFHLEFPLDLTGALAPVTISLRIESPQFEPKSQTKDLRVPPSGDSEVCRFLMVPQTAGQLTVMLEAVALGVSQTSRVLQTSAATQRVAQPAGMFVVSMPLFTASTVLRPMPPPAPSAQYKLDRVRPPRVEIDYEPTVTQLPAPASVPRSPKARRTGMDGEGFRHRCGGRRRGPAGPIPVEPQGRPTTGHRNHAAGRDRGGPGYRSRHRGQARGRSDRQTRRFHRCDRRNRARDGAGGSGVGGSHSGCGHASGRKRTQAAGEPARKESPRGGAVTDRTALRLALCAVMAGVPGAAQYAGSSACKSCHPRIYERWRKTPMANVVRDPREHPDAILPDSRKPNPLVTFKQDDVALVYGSQVEAALFPEARATTITRCRRSGMSPIRSGGHTLSRTEPTGGCHSIRPDNTKRPTGPLCDGCHSVNYNVQTKTVTEWNVGCERCHGPGGEQCEASMPPISSIPRGWIPYARNDICIQCHSQGRPLKNPIEGKYYDWPVGFHPGVDCRTSGNSKSTSSARRPSPITPTAPRTRTGCRGTISCRA